MLPVPGKIDQQGPAQVLTLDPSTELRFRGPFTDVVTASLTLSNSTEKRVCFKVKTTAPKRYCVRPNSGLLEPGAKTNVAVMLQPFDYDPNEKNKHKFMVQTMIAPEGKIESQDSLWKDAPLDSLMDSKLKCVFEMPVDTEKMVNLSAEEAVKVSGLKSAPEKPGSPKTNKLDSELRKALEDVKRLQQENSSLKQENNELQIQKARLRNVAMSDTVTSTPAPQSPGLQTAVAPVNTIPPIVYLIAAIFLGMIIGKLVV